MATTRIYTYRRIARGAYVRTSYSPGEYLLTELLVVFVPLALLAHLARLLVQRWGVHPYVFSGLLLSALVLFSLAAKKEHGTATATGLVVASMSLLICLGMLFSTPTAGPPPAVLAPTSAFEHDQRVLHSPGHRKRRAHAKPSAAAGPEYHRRAARRADDGVVSSSQAYDMPRWTNGVEDGAPVGPLREHTGWHACLRPIPETPHGRPQWRLRQPG
jgi:hypothetical protein